MVAVAVDAIGRLACVAHGGVSAVPTADRQLLRDFIRQLVSQLHDPQGRFERRERRLHGKGDKTEAR